MHDGLQTGKVDQQMTNSNSENSDDEDDLSEVDIDQKNQKAKSWLMHSVTFDAEYAK